MNRENRSFPAAPKLMLEEMALSQRHTDGTTKGFGHRHPYQTLLRVKKLTFVSVLRSAHDDLRRICAESQEHGLEY